MADDKKEKYSCPCTESSKCNEHRKTDDCNVNKFIKDQRERLKKNKA